MIGAIIGDIVGSRFEFHNIKTKDFVFFAEDCAFTDDTVMTIAVGNALRKTDNPNQNLRPIITQEMQQLGLRYPDVGYGRHFKEWLSQKNPKPYHSFGNGAAMRVSACGIVATSMSDVKKLTQQATDISHNHPEALKAAFVTAGCVFLARHGASKSIIFDFVKKDYNLDFRLSDIRATYQFDVSCQGTIPVALAAFFESESFEDAIRNAISMGGDADTLAAITGSIAGAYYGIPRSLYHLAISYLDEPLKADLAAFEVRWSPRLI